MKTILIADDEFDNRAIASTILKKAGYAVLEAVDAHEALATAERSRPDLVLLDMSLPGLSGWEAAPRFKALPGGAMPVLAFTAHALKGDEERALAAGCDGYVSKPCAPAALLAAVRGFLEVPR
jgi:two-component system, cell cycle response regulator DivK